MTTTDPLPVHEALDRVLEAQVVTAAAAAAEKDARADLVRALAAARTSKHTADDGSACRLEKRGPSVTVANETEYRAWVRQHHPDALRDMVDPVWQRTHLAVGKGVDVVVTADAEDVVDTTTGELIPGVRVAPAPAPKLVVTPRRETEQ